jgi:uncharacterized membrane protein YphA (DoxX/SURF4 family)
LLILRCVVGGTATIQGSSYLANIGDPSFATWALGLITVASGASLLVGFLTPATGAVAGVSTILIVSSWIPPFPADLLIDRVAALFVIADAAAVVLLGPGAHSLDAYLFGRREIIIPHESPSR